MCNKLFLLLVVGAVDLGCGLEGSAAPKLADKEASEREKAIKEFVAKVIIAIGKKDLDALVDLCEVPFNHQPGRFERNSAKLKSNFHKGMDVKPKFEGKHEVKRIQTFGDAKARLEEHAVKDYKEVLTEDDFLIHVEVQYPDRKLQWRLLIKMKDGKTRLVGWGIEDEE